MVQPMVTPSKVTEDTMEVKGEKEKGSVRGSVSIESGVGASGGGNSASGGEVDGAVGGAVEGENGCVEEGEIEPGCGDVPQMSRNRLREILHHSEGKCV